MTERQSDPSKLHVALLVNFLPPYRIPLLQELAARLGKLQIFLSTPMEADRGWKADYGNLDVTLQKTRTFTRIRRHPHGFQDKVHIHIPYDTLPLLRKNRPQVVISGELGARSLQAAIYRGLNPQSRLILWATLSEHTEKARGLFRETLRRVLIPRADGVIVNGESGSRYINRFGAPPKKIFKIPQTTDLKPFLGTECRPSSRNTRRVLYAGRLIELKGLIPFLKLLNQYAEANPARTIEFWIAGDGPIRTDLQAFSRARNLELKILGELPYHRLPAVYQQCDCLVFPTLADEWGLVVIEAMASGLPILGSRYGQACEELIEPGKTGWLFDICRPTESLLMLQTMMASSNDRLFEMGKRAREKISTLTPQLVAGKITDMLSRVV